MEFKIDTFRRYIEYGNTRFSFEIFKYFALDAKRGDIFKFVERKNGVVTVKKVLPVAKYTKGTACTVEPGK